MSANKPIVAKTKSILKEYGYEVKTSHIYELFSKLSGEANWNVANAKGTSFENVIRTLSKVTPIGDSERDFKNLLSLLHSGRLTDAMYLGDFIKEGTPCLVNPLIEPGVIYWGMMGAGKSCSLRTTLVSYLLGNWHHSMIFLIDPLLGAHDHEILFAPSIYGQKKDDRPFKQVYKFNSTDESVSQAISLAFDELCYRTELFNYIRATSYLDYEEKVGNKEVFEHLQKRFPGRVIPKKISRILLAFEEFHAIPNILDFENKVRKPGTAAKKLASISQVGRIYGITILLASQRADLRYIPDIIKNSTANTMVHNSSSPSDMSSNGRCFCEKGEIQFPSLICDKDGLKKVTTLLKETVKEAESECAYLTPENINKTIKEGANLTLAKMRLLEETSNGRFEYQPEKATKETVLTKEELAELIRFAQSKGISVEKGHSSANSLIFSEVSEKHAKTLIDGALELAKKKAS